MIPTRDELIDRAEEALGHAGCLDRMKRGEGSCYEAQRYADFALAEIRRAVVAELETLLPHSESCSWVYSNGRYSSALRATLDARLAALRQRAQEASQ